MQQNQKRVNLRGQQQHEYRNRMNMAIARTVKNKMKKTEIDEIDKIWR